MCNAMSKGSGMDDAVTVLQNGEWVSEVKCKFCKILVHRLVLSVGFIIN